MDINKNEPKKILIVDDEEGICESVKKLLTDLKGYEVEVAHNGEEALKVVSWFCPDCIIMDNKMPHMKGTDATSYLREYLPQKKFPKVIFISGSDDEYERREAFASGAILFISKPFGLAQILSSLERILS